MEKPGGTDVEKFRELVSILKEKKLVFSLGYMYRFNPKIKEAMQKIENGELGEIYAVEAHMDCIHPASTRQWLSNFPGGMLFFLGCHLIDLIYRIQGEPLDVIPLSCSTGFDGVTAEDYGMVVFKYKNGVSFAKTSACELGGYRRRQLVICGEKGTIELKPLEAYTDNGLYTVMNEAYDLSWHKPWITSQSAPCDRYDAMMRNFAEMIRGKENPYSYDYELALYKLVLKACGREI
jgi:predicted dehydrogenase